MIRDVETRVLEGSDLLALKALQSQGLFALREGDTKECLAIGLSPVDAIVQSAEQSVMAYAVFVNQELILTWGFVSKNPLSGIVYPWLLTTPAIEKHKMFFARGSVKARDYLLERYNRLDIIVAAEYLRAHAWLEWLGFSAPGASFEVNGTSFVYMILERK